MRIIFIDGQSYCIPEWFYKELSDYIASWKTPIDKPKFFKKFYQLWNKWMVDIHAKRSPAD